MKALVTKASECCFSEGKELEKQGKLKSKKVTKSHFSQALKTIRPSVQGKEKIRYEKTRQELMLHPQHSNVQESILTLAVEHEKSSQESVEMSVQKSAIESVKETNRLNSVEESVKESNQESVMESIEESVGKCIQSSKFTSHSDKIETDGKGFFLKKNLFLLDSSIFM